MHTALAFLCSVVVMYWLIYPHPSGLLHRHCCNLTIAPVPAKQPWWIWVNASCEFIMNDYITTTKQSIQYIPRNMHTALAFLCSVVVMYWLIYPHPSGLLHRHCCNLTIAPVPAKQPWWIWVNASCEFIMNDYITTTKQSTTKPCANFLGYTVYASLGLSQATHRDQNKLDAISQTTFHYFCANFCIFIEFLTKFVPTCKLLIR